MSKPIEVFISYAHEDSSSLRKLETYLTSLKRQNIIETWSNADIKAGEEWKRAINAHLDSAQVFLLLISADFIASDNCYGDEMGQAVRRHNCGKARVIPIILSAIPKQARESAPFGKLQALPIDTKQSVKPIKSWRDQNLAYTRVADGIHQAIKDLSLASSSTSAPHPTDTPSVNPPHTTPQPEVQEKPLNNQSTKEQSSPPSEEIPISPIGPPSSNGSVATSPASPPGQQRLATAVNWLNRRLAPIVNRLNRDWGSLAVLMLIVAFFMSDVASTNSYQLTFANNLAIAAYYLALVVFFLELCVLAVYVLAVRQQWRWLWLVGLVGLVVVWIIVYLPGINFSLGGRLYESIAIIVPFVFSWLVWVFALRKPIGSKSQDQLPR